jgi:hypothetical protein
MIPPGLKTYRSPLLVFAILLLPAVQAIADEAYYFYRGRSYGTEGLVHPLRMILNGGYGIMQLDNRDGEIFEVDYAQGWHNTWQNISDPGYAIQDRGWEDFFRREIIPVSFNYGRAQYWPNYTLHLIGGGMSYRLMREWYRYNDFGHERLWAASTLGVYHVLNEVVEHANRQGPNTDPVADLLIFDPLGLLLFESDRVSNLFGNRLHMAEWPYQPAYDPQHRVIENNGQNFVLKYPVPGTNNWDFLYHFGTHGEAGLSRRLTSGHAISAGIGLKAKRLIDLGDNLNSVDLALAGGIFLDHENSLLASLLLASTKDYKARLNVYPGLRGPGTWPFGFFAALSREDEPVAGITFSFWRHLPLGLASGF